MRPPTAALSFGLGLTVAMAGVAASADAATRYVNVNLQGGANDGSSWENAFRDANGVAMALAASASGDQVWVAAGTYKPTTATTRTAYHTLKTGVAISFNPLVVANAEITTMVLASLSTCLTAVLLDPP